VNREDDFELRLTEWLEEGPFSAPNRAVAAAISHARKHPRRRLLSVVFRRIEMSEIHAAPVAPRRFLHPGRTLAAVAASIAVVAVLVVSGLAVLATRQSNTAGPGPATTPAPSTGAQGHIYWASHRDGTIGRADIDGSGVNPSFITGVASPCGVAVIGDHIYWGDDTDNTIGRANLDGTGVNPKFITGTLGACTVVSDGTYLYWPTRSGSETGSIGRARLDGTEVNQTFIGGDMGVMPPNLVGIAISGSDLYWGSTVPYIARGYLDSGSANGYFISLDNPPSGVAISGGYIYWGNGQGTTIGRANQDGTGVDETFLGISGNPGGLATDGKYLYWTAAGAIGRANLDGTGVNESFIRPASPPVAVAVGG
jgi:virginiamycin B lyase